MFAINILNLLKIYLHDTKKTFVLYTVFRQCLCIWVPFRKYCKQQSQIYWNTVSGEGTLEQWEKKLHSDVTNEEKPNINNATLKTPFVVMKYSLAVNWLNYPFLDIPVCSLYRVRWNINFALEWIWQWADDSRWLMTSPGQCDILHSKRRAECQVQNKENPEDVCVSPMLSDFFDITRETSHPEC